MAEPSNLDLIREGIDAFNRGDWEVIVGALAEDVEWKRVEGLPDGAWRAPRPRRRSVRFLQPDVFAASRFEALEVVEGDDVIMVHGVFRATGAQSGIELDVEAYTVYKLNDQGLARRVENWNDRADGGEIGGPAVRRRRPPLERQVVGDLGEARGGRVALGDLRLGHRPLDPDLAGRPRRSRPRSRGRRCSRACSGRRRPRRARRIHARTRPGRRTGGGARRRARTPPIARRSASRGGGPRRRPRSAPAGSGPASPARASSGNAARAGSAARARVVVLDEVDVDAELAPGVGAEASRPGSHGRRRGPEARAGPSPRASSRAASASAQRRPVVALVVLAVLPRADRQPPPLVVAIPVRPCARSPRRSRPRRASRAPRSFAEASEYRRSWPRRSSTYSISDSSRPVSSRIRLTTSMLGSSSGPPTL